MHTTAQLLPFPHCACEHINSAPAFGHELSSGLLQRADGTQLLLLPTLGQASLHCALRPLALARCALLHANRQSERPMHIVARQLASNLGRETFPTFIASVLFLLAPGTARDTKRKREVKEVCTPMKQHSLA